MGNPIVHYVSSDDEDYDMMDTDEYKAKWSLKMLSNLFDLINAYEGSEFQASQFLDDFCVIGIDDEDLGDTFICMCDACQNGTIATFPVDCNHNLRAEAGDKLQKLQRYIINNDGIRAYSSSNADNIYLQYLCVLFAACKDLTYGPGVVKMSDGYKIEYESSEGDQCEWIFDVEQVSCKIGIAEAIYDWKTMLSLATISITEE